MDAIVVDNLRKHYGDVEALRGVTLTVQTGEIFGLLGANGAGKTTLIRTLIGSLMPTSGDVTVLSMNPKQTPSLRHQIGYMPQNPALYEDLSGRANVRFFAQAHRLAHLDQRADEVLKFVGLFERQHDPIYAYSGGMKQRLSLACTLVHQPRILMLDEPTTGVDPKLREAFWQHFRNLTEQGVTIMVSTHQMDEALHCDRLAIMRDGVVLVCDTPRNILRRGRTRVSIWQGNDVSSEAMTEYPTELPEILSRYDGISRIEIEQDTMEDVVLSMIHVEGDE